jgi:uncharacterized membrane protein YkvA (DUF1232 family)
MMAMADDKYPLTSHNIVAFLLNVLVATGAIWYLMTVADVIADAIPILGFVDDAAVILLAFAMILRMKKSLRRN